jgi:hypothetical protein
MASVKFACRQVGTTFAFLTSSIGNGHFWPVDAVTIPPFATVVLRCHLIPIFFRGAYYHAIQFSYSLRAVACGTRYVLRRGGRLRAEGKSVGR